MRIISGTARGRKLFTPGPRDKTIRPTSDKARQALFNILGNRVVGARVLDLFAGTGAVGLEAWSRGAELVVFVDGGASALKLIKRNVLLCLQGRDDAAERVRVISHDLSRGLPEARLSQESSNGFDLIFADPPYGLGHPQTILESINSTRLLADNGILIVEERHRTELPQLLGSLELTQVRRYGDSGFYFYRQSESR